VVFTVKKTLKKEPNQIDLKIYNLSEASRGQMKSKGSLVTLSAGYEQNNGLIFTGDSRSVDHVHEGPDWITHVRCGDGEKAFEFNRISKSFNAGATVKQVITDVAKSVSANIGNVPKVLAGQLKFDQFVNGFVAHGDASKVFDDLIKSQGLTWSIQDGALQLRNGDGPAVEDVFTLSSSTGLIGSPDHTTPTDEKKPSVLKVKSFLIPQIRCGGMVDIQSRSINGRFVVLSLTHEGDSHGPNWFTSMEVQAKP